MSHMYMQPNRRRPKNSDYIRTYAPYGATALLVVVLFWGVDSIKQDTQRRQFEPLEVVQPLKPKDWTHKLSTVAPYEDKGRPDDDTSISCPLPSGNWGHTCEREVIVEGPCSGKCMLKAKCQDVKENFKETTFEYNEGRQMEIKNVNGLLCSIEDGSPSCGLNFHGNLAFKNCAGYIPVRHEVIVDGLYAKPKKYEDDWPEKDPDTDDTKKKAKRFDIDDYTYDKYKKKLDEDRKKKAKPLDDFDEYDTKRSKRSKRDGDEDTDNYRPKSGVHRVEEEDEDTRDAHVQKKSFEEHEEFRPKRAAPPKYDDRRGRKNEEEEDDDLARREPRNRYQDADWDEEGDDDRMLRGQRRSRYDDDDRPLRRLHEADKQ